jgi:hypothetical protein
MVGFIVALIVRRMIDLLPARLCIAGAWSSMFVLL